MSGYFYVRAGVSGGVRLIFGMLVMHEQVRSFFFFFQAEDGIRYLTVTGVQTCALPITASVPPVASAWAAGASMGCAAVRSATRPAMPATCPRRWGPARRCRRDSRITAPDRKSVV